MSHSDSDSEDEDVRFVMDPKERAGITSAEAEKLYETVGFNELPHIEVSLLWLFFSQFTGVMPYMLEVAFILALAIQSYPDFAIIFGIVLCNGVLGFTEELKAKSALDKLTEKMEQKIATLRDGSAQQLLTRLLVPGDVILLVGGAMVPADVDWLEGDVLSVDTAALTGEPLPRKYPSKDYGRTILCGATIVAGEAYCVVRKTGANTEIGSSQAAIMQDKTEKKISLFEDRILMAVKVIIFVSVLDVIVILLVQGIARNEFNKDPRELIASCLSIVIASVPVALPLVLQVTMALGAGMMARDHNAVITSLPALQDIASMTVLCSDKTGTLTTAKISIIQDAVWPAEGFTKEDVAFYAGLASNRDKKEDPIDRAVIQHFDRTLPAAKASESAQYKLLRSVGFNPIYKRVLWQYDHPVHGVVTVVKGLPNKVVDTAEGGVDDADDQFKVAGHEKLLTKVQKLDAKLSKAGYKTLGVSVQIGLGSPWRYVGILPMLDPPRHDTAQTISNLLHAKVRVKMITGDHLNIAKETARLIGLGINMYKGEEIRDASEIRDEMIQQTGFSMLWAYASYRTNWFKSDFDIFQCTDQAQSGVWVQVFVAAEILIFSARAPTYFWNFLPPSPALFISVTLGCLIVTILACASPFFGNIWVQDAVIIWVYNLICFVIVDTLKVLVLHFLGETFEPLESNTTATKHEATTTTATAASAQPVDVKSIAVDVESQDGRSSRDNDTGSRADSAVAKLAQWKQSTASTSVAIGASPGDIIDQGDASRSMSSSNIRVLRNASNAALVAARRTVSATPAHLAAGSAYVAVNQRTPSPATPAGAANAAAGAEDDLAAVVREGRITVSPSYLSNQNSAIDLRRTNLSSTSLRPHTPANIRSRR
eukprot:gene5652-4044_t